MHSIRIAALAIAFSLLTTSSVRAQESNGDSKLPMANSPSVNYVMKPLTLAQQQARFEADQRMLRLQWNKWIAHDPLRPTMNASYMSNGVQRFYIPRRAVIVSAYAGNAWYW